MRISLNLHSSSNTWSIKFHSFCAVWALPECALVVTTWRITNISESFAIQLNVIDSLRCTSKIILKNFKPNLVLNTFSDVYISFVIIRISRIITTSGTSLVDHLDNGSWLNNIAFTPLSSSRSIWSTTMRILIMTNWSPDGYLTFPNFFTISPLLNICPITMFPVFFVEISAK
jgi:hypothetical protein